MEVIIMGIVLAFSMQYAKKRKVKLIEFILNFVMFSALIYVIHFVVDYTKSIFHLSMRFAGLVFFIGCCAIVFMFWRQFKNQRKYETK
ncbi:hypothetical protein [Bacillus sp. AFS017336]|uniref:hypothetical protein n=1 Tax=Bacillus sp. AFS017336 TaxID=2033489 RepID=UPI000BEFDCA6|nr:hypothetical protein [Bacillus sp. AFS017336]PEL14476.1 hypothetical protein CN601_00200 [Bacillus sp. AFS017336]